MTNTPNTYTPYTIKGSGVSLFIKPLAPELLKQVAKAYPEPEPPRERIQAADGSWYETDNRMHPDYLDALERRETKINNMISDLCIELGTLITLTDAQKAETQAYRETVKRIAGIEPEGAIEVAYLKYIALANVVDLRDLLRAILSLMRPDEKKLTSGSITSEQPTTESQSGDDPQDGAEQATRMS